jgi:hypothetical protein
VLTDAERTAVEAILDDRLVEQSLVWDRAHVVRVVTSDGRSAIAKRPRVETGGEVRPEARGSYLHELVGLSLLASMPASPAPHLLGVADGVDVLVMEELPPGPSVADGLLGGDRATAEAAVVGLAETLAAVAAWTIGREDEHRALRAQVGLDPDGAQRWTGLVGTGVVALREAAGDFVEPGFDDDVAKVLADLAGPGWWRGYVHGDPCPDNTSRVDGRWRLFDYEYAAYSSVLLDASFVVAPFPTCWCFVRIPPVLSATATAAYRRVLGASVPEATDDAAWDAALAAALVSWVLACGGVIGKALGEDWIWGTTGLRPRLLRWLDAYLAVPAGADRYPAVTATLAALRRRLGAAWPDATTPDYPALPTPGDHPTALTPDWWTPWDADH